MKVNKQIVTVVILVPLGFLCAFFLFRFLTSRVSVDQSLRVASREEKIAPPSPVVLAKTPKDASEGMLEEKSKPAPAKSAPKPKRQVIVEDKYEYEKVIFPPLRVNGIFSSDTGNVALINDVILREGDSILGVKILRIDTRQVEMEMAGETKIIRIK